MVKASSKRYLKIVEAAKKAALNAYAPYSGIRVGAAVKTKKGKIYIGCNVENASTSLTICAERNAIASAIAYGDTNFRYLALYSPNIEYIVPCGGCAQFLSEFNKELLIITAGHSELFRIYLLKDLLPKPFMREGR